MKKNISPIKNLPVKNEEPIILYITIPSMDNNDFAEF